MDDSTPDAHLQELLARAQSGDRVATEQLLTALEPELSRHIRIELRSLGMKSDQGVDRNAETASVLNTVFVRFLNLLNSREPQPILHLIAYLKSALTHEIIARANRNTRFETKSTIEPSWVTAVDPRLAELQGIEDRQIAEAAVEMSFLSTTERSVLSLLQEGHSVKAIAEALNLTEGVVRARKSSALRKVREQVQKSVHP